jgi:hypothetical protein
VEDLEQEKMPQEIQIDKAAVREVIVSHLHQQTGSSDYAQ